MALVVVSTLLWLFFPDLYVICTCLTITLELFVNRRGHTVSAIGSRSFIQLFRHSALNNNLNRIDFSLLKKHIFPSGITFGKRN